MKDAAFYKKFGKIHLLRFVFHGECIALCGFKDTEEESMISRPYNISGYNPNGICGPCLRIKKARESQ